MNDMPQWDGYPPLPEKRGWCLLKHQNTNRDIFAAWNGKQWLEPGCYPADPAYAARWWVFVTQLYTEGEVEARERAAELRGEQKGKLLGFEEAVKELDRGWPPESQLTHEELLRNEGFRDALAELRAELARRRGEGEK